MTTATTATACDIYCDKHAVCRLLNDQPVHYCDCERFNVSNAGFAGKCDCTATADVNEVLDAIALAHSDGGSDA